MEKTSKAKTKPVLKTERKENNTRRKLKLAFVFLAGTALAGCGDTINNTYYYGPDGGAKPDAVQMDSGAKPDTTLPDTLVPDTLKPDSKPECTADTSCVVSAEKVTLELTIPGTPVSVATLKEGESQTFSGFTLNVKSINETVANDPSCLVTDKKAVLELTDSNGTTQVTIGEGESVTVSGVTTRALGINVGMNGLNCQESGSLAFGTLNQGESLFLGKYKLVFEDGQQVADKVYALIDVIDSCGTSVEKLKVEEGKTAALKLDSQMLTVSAHEVAVGSTFAAKWTKLSVTKQCETLPSTCSVNVTALQCSDTVPLVSGTVGQGQSLLIQSAPGIVKYQLTLDDGQTLNGKNYAIVSFTDSCGNILTKKKLEENTTTQISLNGEQFEVTVDSAAFGYTFGAKWAEFTVRAPCTTTYWCTSMMGILNQGDSLSVDNYKIQLDDLATINGVPYAMLSVLDANGNTITKAKVAEASSVDLKLGGNTVRISVPEVAPGYTFGGKWAKVEVQSPYSKPCGSP